MTTPVTPPSNPPMAPPVTPPRRIDGRADTALRALSISAGINPYTPGSAEVRLGNTLVLITAGFRPPKENERRRVSTTLQTLPHASLNTANSAADTELEQNELRGLEQLCNRAFELALGSSKLDGHVITLDCTIACADGGVATAAIAGGWVAIFRAISSASASGKLKQEIKVVRTAAITAGTIGTRVVVDLLGSENQIANFQSTLVFDSQKHLIALHGQSRLQPIPPGVIAEMLIASVEQLDSILKEQERAILA